MSNGEKMTTPENKMTIFQFKNHTFHLDEKTRYHLRCTDIGDDEGVLNWPNDHEVSELAKLPLRCVSLDEFNHGVYQRAEEGDGDGVLDIAALYARLEAHGYVWREGNKVDWATWHLLPAPPDDRGQRGYGRIWLQWAVARFTLLVNGPQPFDYPNMGDWVEPFQTAWKASSACTRHLCRVLLDAYNDDVKWRLPRPKSIPDLARRLDHGNRRGLAALIVHAKGF